MNADDGGVDFLAEFKKNKNQLNQIKVAYG